MVPHERDNYLKSPPPRTGSRIHLDLQERGWGGEKRWKEHRTEVQEESDCQILPDEVTENEYHGNRNQPWASG